jgi:hypothetical protein
VGGTTSIGDKTYCTYYTHPWISCAEFDPSQDDKLTAKQADQINAITDIYNAFIAESVELARRRGHDWYLFDACKLLDGFASGASALPARLQAVTPPIDTQSFETDSTGRRTQGGLFSLDGVHPTTVGYAVIANAILDVMDHAGVRRSPDPSDQAFNAAGEINFDFILANDSLLRRPPKSLKATHGLFEELMDGWQMVQVLRGVL